VQKPHLTPGLFWRGVWAVAGRGEEGTAVRVALGLLDLERGLDVGAREVLLAHARQHEVCVLLARQRAEHGHERELVVEVADGIHAGGLGGAAGAGRALRDGRGAELDDTRDGLLDAGCDGGESLLRALDDGEQVIVRAEAHTGDLLDMHGLDRGPHLRWVVVVVDDMSALQAGQVCKDITGRFLPAVPELVQLALVRRFELRVERLFLSRERDRGNGRGGGPGGLVWSGLVGSGLALVWSCSKISQSLLDFLMWD
jgi:hypothetical protein